MDGHSRTGRLLVGLTVVVLAGCAASASPTPTPASPTSASLPPGAVATPTPPPTPTASPTPTLIASPIAYGLGTVVQGTESCTATPGKSTTDADGMIHVRDGVIECTATSNDPRVSGTSRYTWNLDGTGSSFAVQWGTGRITNAGGSWDGTFSAAYNDSTGDVLYAWFKGAGGYAKLSYVMWERLAPAEVSWTYPVQGMIYPGSPPTR